MCSGATPFMYNMRRQSLVIQIYPCLLQEHLSNHSGIVVYNFVIFCASVGECEVPCVHTRL